MQQRDYNMRTRRRRGAGQAPSAPFSFISRTALLNLAFGLIIGLAIGLGYAWGVAPVDYTDTNPSTLRLDHQYDYILMIAQAYTLDGDLAAARARLEPLGLDNPGQYIANLTGARIQLGTPPEDLRALAALTVGLGAVPPALP